MIRVLIADDQALIRAAISALLRTEIDVEIVAVAADGRAAVDLARALGPDVVLMDIRMPTLDGIRATAEICAAPELAGTRVLVLTTFEEDENVVAALRAGASGFLGKGADPGAIVEAIRVVHAGEALLSQAATRALIRRAVAARPTIAAPTLPADLTEREIEVLRLVGRGFANDEIAHRLVISPATAKTHVNRTMTKLDAHDRAQLVIAAYESGLVVAGDERP